MLNPCVSEGFSVYLHMKICGIYKITSPSGRIYIGQSVNIQERWRIYKVKNTTKSQIKLKRSFDKYGVEKHKFEVIEECPRDILNERERYWQEHYDVLNKGLNCVLTNTNDLPKVYSNEIRVNISNGLKGKLCGDKNPNYGKGLKGVLNPNYGKKMSLEQREKLSKAHKGKKLSEEHKKKLSEVRKGVKSLGKHHFAKKVINIETGEIYSCAKEVSLLFNINYGTLKSWLKFEHRNKTPFRDL